MANLREQIEATKKYLAEYCSWMGVDTIASFKNQVAIMEALEELISRIPIREEFTLESQKVYNCCGSFLSTGYHATGCQFALKIGGGTD